MSTEADIFNSIKVNISDFVTDNVHLLIHVHKIIAPNMYINTNNTDKKTFGFAYTWVILRSKICNLYFHPQTPYFRHEFAPFLTYII